MSDAYRLPRTVLPRRYDLLIMPNLEQSTFGGEVAITVEVTEATDMIVLHARDLDVSLGGIEHPGGVAPGRLEVDAAAERIVVHTPETIAAGEATLRFTFAGEISHGMLGFYRSTFADADGREQVLAATQFEAPHARAAFPCFDEPEFKAVFGVTLEVQEGLLALSNGPEVSRRPLGDGRIEVQFADTIPMSTYLVAWVVGPLELTPPVDAGGVAVRVAHVPGKAHLTKFALDVGSFAITFFAEYYGIPYPGSKCDLVALPDFSFGAMENLGCVTFRETRLLLDPSDVTLDEMMAAALTIVHEIAHMWFGDLVTMKWWNGIWLNEAFATFMEHIGVDAYRADWQTWDDFAVGRATALDVDALANTRTVEYEVRTPEDADGMFDTLTYQKGGSVLRMLEQWLGAEPFRAGVRRYLQQYRLSNTETTDLWDALEAATDAPVRRIMDSWIFQPGFPVLRPANGGVEQQRFTYEPGAGGDYVVPALTRVHDGDKTQTVSLLLGTDGATIDASESSLVVFNAGGQGFYRVAYPPEWRNRLLDAGVLSPLERFTIIDDLWAFVLAGDAAAAEFLACARRFGDERDLIVWRILASHLGAASRLVDGDALGQYRAAVVSLAAPALDDLGWDAAPADDERTRQLRGIVVRTLGSTAAHAGTVANARARVAQPDGVDADVLTASIVVVAGAGTVDDFETYVRRSNDATSPQEQLRYLHALGDFPDASLVQRACELAMSEQVRPQNTPFVLQRALRNRECGRDAWGFVRDNWDAICARMSGALVSRMLEGATWLVADDSFADINAFLEAHPLPEAARTIAQHRDRLRVHRETVERERERFAAYLRTLT